jgi:hypothetical protein
VSRLARTVQTGDPPPSNRGVPHSSAGQWVLVQVWDGAVLARFDDELSARAATTRLDDDEIVVLHVNA